MRLGRRDVEHLLQRKSAGHLVMFRFRHHDKEAERWNLIDAANILKGLPDQYQTRSFEIWATHAGVSLGVWAQDEDSAKRLVEQWRTFNPTIHDEHAPRGFPPLRPGDHVRLGTVRPRRSPAFPIMRRFGRQDHDLIRSPLVLLVNNLAHIPDGTTLVVQVLWRRNRLPWQVLQYTKLDLKPWLHTNHEACEEKRQERLNYHVDIRIAEIRSNPGTADHARAAGTGFHVYKQDGGNQLVYRPLRGARWRKRRFLAAMMDRNLAAFRQRGINRSRLSTSELAALVHPPPEGARLTRLAFTPVTQDKISPHRRLQTERLERALDSLPGRGARPVGTPRRMTAREVQEALHRQGTERGAR